MPAKPIIAALREVRSAVLQITLFTCLLDVLVVFLLAALVLILVTLPWWYGAVLAALYGVAHTYRTVRKHQNLAYVEEKAPELEEQLITVADTVDKENPIVESLQQDVIRGMRAIKTSSFLSFGRLARELITLAVVSVLIITAAAHNIRFLDFRETLRDLGKLTEPAGAYELTGEGLEFVENLSEDIYGNKTIAELGNEELQLQLTPMLTDIDIGKTKPPESREFTSTLPKEIKATTDVSFQESIPKGYQRIVKSYFSEIAKTSK
jgi:membrane protein implicated in regulation of membrane protease activity